MTARVVCWFSCGAASAVATKLALSGMYGEDVVIAYTDPGSEHPDNVRFLADCEAWFGQDIVRLKNIAYDDTWAVWEKRRFIIGDHGAPCTGELKRKLRFEFQRIDDRQVFGYHAGEQDRADLFREQNPEVELLCPLIDRSLTKADCLAIIDRAGIEVPAMYRLGFRNNNCIGCPKGAMGYWNHIRRHFPDTFARMAALERELGHAVNKDDDGPVYLDELDPDRGDLLTEQPIDCSLLCHGIAEGTRS